MVTQVLRTQKNTNQGHTTWKNNHVGLVRSPNTLAEATQVEHILVMGTMCYLR